MKRIILLLIAGFFALNTSSNPIVGGDTTRINGKLVLYLMAGHYENGFYYGSLMGDRIMEIMDNYVINHAFGGAANYQLARQVFEDHFTVDNKYAEIANGMIAGIEFALGSTYSTALGENLNYIDVLIANSIPDFTAFSGLLKIRGPGCSNLTSWGESTTGDPALDGETVISRNLDWENNAYLINNPLIIVWGGAEGNSQRFVTLGYPGMIGALSGFNESGVATFQNMGNHYMSPQGSDFYPVNLAQRNGLESEDFNGDGICSPRDVSDAVSQNNVASTFIIHSAGPSWLEIPAEVLEIHNSLGSAIRTSDASTPFFSDNLIATNHFRSLTSPSPCYRYSRICDSLEVSSQMTMQRNWNVLKTAGVYNNLQTIQFTPWNNILRISYAEPGIPAYQIEPTQINADELFMLVGIEELSDQKGQRIVVYPNPADGSATISINHIESIDSFHCRILDIHGRLVKDFGLMNAGTDKTDIFWHSGQISEGAYYVTVRFIHHHKAASTETAKIVVVR